MKIIRKYKWRLLWLSLLGLLLIWLNFMYISFSSKDLIFSNRDDIPKTEYALFLGTPKFLSDGSVNNYYKNRINAAVELYKHKKAKRIIISADSLNKYQENEVELIKSDLVQKGIDVAHLVLDKNGNRTWKSIQNLNGNQGIRKVILISQKFHLERAIYISKKKSIDAIGFVAKGKMSNKLWLREFLARVKMQLDLLLK